MTGFRRLIAQVDASQLATQAVNVSKTTLHIETFTGTLPPGTRYRSFTTAFGTPPAISITFAGTTVRMAAGTFSVSYRFDRVRPGSIRWQGTPSVRATVFAEGFR